jgi:D-3-phosphoglycerate dehydrogenase
MSDSVVEALILDFLEWLNMHERTYEEVMDAWHTSCPRLQVWEEANDRGFITKSFAGGRELVGVTSSGQALLDRHLARQSNA